MKEAYTKLIARHFDAEWELSDKEFDLNTFYHFMYYCMAKNIVFHIIRYYGNDEKKWYAGYRYLWREHNFLCPELFCKSVMMFDKKPNLSRIRWMVRISSLYSGVKLSKSGAKSCVEMIRYYTKWWGGSVNELVRGHS